MWFMCVKENSSAFFIQVQVTNPGVFKKLSRLTGTLKTSQLHEGLINQTVRLREWLIV